MSTFPRRRSYTLALYQCQPLEPRQLLTALFVTPVNIATDATHFHTIADAVAAVHTGDVITLQDGALPDTTVPTLSVPGITIQGDPNLPAADIALDNLTVAASNITLRNLNLNILTVNVDISALKVLKCDLVHVNGTNQSTSSDGNSVYDSNVITGGLLLYGNLTGATSDVVTNNTFFTHSADPLIIYNDGGVLVQNNSITTDGANAEGIYLEDCGLNTVVANNTFSLSNGAQGIDLLSTSAVHTMALRNNVISTNGKGIGILLSTTADANMQVIVEGNDVRNNLIGVEYAGASGSIASDLGGGSLGSKGGNNFRSFNAATANLGGYAIVSSDASPDSTLPAHGNIFAAGVSLATVDNTDGTTIDATALSPANAFVVALYNQILGRTPNASDQTYWSGVFTKSGQAAVVNGILHSAESFSRIVNSYYVSYLGHGGDSAGIAYWTNLLNHGATLESVQTGFLSSTEFLATHNSSFVQSLYGTLLHRSASSSDLTYWYSQLPTLGIAGIASALVNSTESRSDAITALFKTSLHRAPSQSDITYFLTKGGSLTIESQILSTGEYFTNG